MINLYNENWIGNIPKYIKKLLFKKEKLVVFLVDGLGYNFSKEIIKDVFEKKPKKLYSTFPSSSSVAITSILTGLKPAEHGIIHTYFQCINGKIIKVLKFRDLEGNYFDLKRYINYKSFFKGLIKLDINVYTYFYSEHLHKYPIFKMWFQKDVTKAFTYKDINDGFRILLNNLKESLGLHFFYTDIYDEHLHKFGLEKSDKILHSLLLKIKNISERADTNIVIFGDHGLEEIKDIVEIDYTEFIGGSREIGVNSRVNIPSDSIIILDSKELGKLLGGECKYSEKFYLTTDKKIMLKVKGFNVPTNKMDHGGLSENEVLVSYVEF